VSEICEVNIPNCTPRNFPLEAFYSITHAKCYIFFRQGQCITIDGEPQNIQDSIVEKVSTKVFGDMFLIYDEIMAIRSNNAILFLKKVKDKWIEYHSLELRGNIFFCRGNVRI